MGVASGCGCKEIYNFFILLFPTPLVSVLFVHFLIFFVLVQVYFVIKL